MGQQSNSPTTKTKHVLLRIHKRSSPKEFATYQKAQLQPKRSHRVSTRDWNFIWIRSPTDGTIRSPTSSPSEFPKIQIEHERRNHIPHSTDKRTDKNRHIKQTTRERQPQINIGPRRKKKYNKIDENWRHSRIWLHYVKKMRFSTKRSRNLPSRNATPNYNQWDRKIDSKETPHSWPIS